MSDPRLRHRPGIHAELWVEPTAEHWFWVRVLPRYLAPSPADERGAVSFWQRVFITPCTNFTILSLRYQSYLNDIFHRTLLARVGHFCLMPLITALMLAALGSWHVVGAVALAAWWLAWGLRERLPLWGVTGVVWAAALDRAAVGFASTGQPAWPFILGFAFLQTLSHSAEPMVPPRFTAASRWLPLAPWLLEPPGVPGKLLRALRVGEGMIYGTFAEAIASPRLAPIQLLELLWRLGYAPDVRREWKAVSRRAWETGNPAIDYIGEGGGTTLR